MKTANMNYNSAGRLAVANFGRRALPAIVAGLAITGLLACTPKNKIEVDGSSTVYPITEAVAEEFRNVNNQVNVTVGVSGTGGGFKKFCNGEIDVADASRHIKSVEIEKCAEAGIEYIELEVAYDGLAVIVNKENSFLKQLTVEQLKTIFRVENPAKTWNEVDPAWPAEEIKVYSPGKDSGTFDYFVEVILGKKAQMRPDASYSEDDNILVTGVAGDKYAIGFFGLAYYEENKDKLNLAAVVNPKSGQAVQPTLETVKSGTYAPLSRPIFIYVSKAALEKPEVQQFVGFYMDSGAELSQAVGYIPLADELYAANKKKVGL
ncbi:MAG: PstS family phosphate ABC transporter substrate-binding protein [bacterium]|nr:PstS family phosphate ABC transporter substrate-binding protein [bacterium]